MTSVREALNVIGQAVSIRGVAHQRGASFPLSIRNLVGALPAGRLRRKVISLDLLRRKFDQFVNERPQPLFKVRLHNIGSGDHRHSTVDVLLIDPVKGEIPQLSGGKPRDLGQLEFDLTGLPNPDFHFSDLNSRAFSVNLIPGQPVGIEARIFFETNGVEMIANNFPNVDLTGFNIRVKFLLEHDPNAGVVNLRTDKTLINTDASVDVGASLPDGWFATDGESLVRPHAWLSRQRSRSDRCRWLTWW